MRAEPRAAEPRFFEHEGRTWLSYAALELPGLIHGIVVFRDLRPGLPHDEWTQVVRACLANRSPVAGMPLVIPHQVHGAKIGVVSCRTDRPAGSTALDRFHRAGARHQRDPQQDGLVTNLAGVAIAVSVADCLPLMAFDAENSVIGVAHCGWRGIAAGVVEEFVRSLEAGQRAAGNARFVIGAGIGACCYRVREDLLKEFTPDEVGRFSSRDAGITTFDLKGTVASRLARCGIAPSDISVDKTCTSCKKDILSSYRADRPDCGRMLAFMALAGGEGTDRGPAGGRKAG